MNEFPQDDLMISTENFHIDFSVVIKMILRATENDRDILPYLVNYVLENKKHIDQFMEKHDLEPDDLLLFSQISALFFAVSLSDDRRKEFAKIRDRNSKERLKLRLEELRHDIEMGHDAGFTIEQLKLANVDNYSEFNRYYTDKAFFKEIIGSLSSTLYKKDVGQTKQIQIVYDLFALYYYDDYGFEGYPKEKKERIRKFLEGINLTKGKIRLSFDK